MARNTITPQVTAVPHDDIDEVAASGTGTGNGVEVAHTNAAPVILVCINRDDSPTTLTIPANGAKAKGITIPDVTKVVAAGDCAYIWLPPDYYSSSGKIGCDVSNATDVTFAALRAGTFS